MKTIITTFLVFITLTAFAQPWKKIEGNGNVKKESREVGSYTAIASAGSWDVKIAYGTSKDIEIEGDDNLLSYIETEVEGNTLKIKSKKYYNLSARRKIIVYVNLTKLTGISLAGSGNIIGSGNFANNGKTNFELAGSGNVNIDFQTIEKVNISIAGSGNVNLAGKANEVDISIAGSGDANAERVIADDVKVSIAGSGLAKVTANKNLKVSIFGSGDVYYKGTASNIKKSVLGSGKVRQL